MNGRNIRLSKLLPKDEKAIVVAIDHGQTFGPMEGLVDCAKTGPPLGRKLSEPRMPVRQLASGIANIFG